MTTVLIDFEEGLLYADKRRTVEKQGVIAYHDYEDKVQDRGCDKDKPYLLVGAGSCASIQELQRSISCLGVGVSVGLLNEQMIDGDCYVTVIKHKFDNVFDIVDYEIKEIKLTWLEKLLKRSSFKLVSESAVRRSGFMTYGSGGNYAYAARLATGCGAKAMCVAATCDLNTSAEFEVWCMKTCRKVKEFVGGELVECSI